MASTNLLDLISEYDRDILDAEAVAQEAIDRVHEAAKAATVARGRLETLRSERATLAKIAEDRGLAKNVAPAPESTIPPEDSADDWRPLTRLDAVERVLKEAEGPMHITDIESVLKFHARTDDSYQYISASLAHLKSRRGTVVAVGQGQWRYNPKGLTARTLGEYQKAMLGGHPITAAMIPEPGDAPGQ